MDRRHSGLDESDWPIRAEIECPVYAERIGDCWRLPADSNPHDSSLIAADAGTAIFPMQ